AWNANLGFHSLGRLLKGNIQPIAQIGAAEHLRATATPSATAATEDIAEDVAEDIAKTATTGAAHACIWIYTRMTVAVIGIALLRIGQNLVGFLGFLEFFFCLVTVRVAIRMILHGEFAIRLLDILVRSVFGQSQGFVVITFCHRYTPL